MRRAPARSTCEPFGAYRRVSRFRAMNGSAERLAARRASGEAPPYLDIEPMDLEVCMFENAALATFHLGGYEEDGIVALEVVDE